MDAQPNIRIRDSGAFIRRLLVLCLLWWVLDEGRTDGWWFGGLVMLGALLARQCFPLSASTWRWSLSGLLRFIPYFLKHSLQGGWDVARRAFRRAMPLEPSLFTYPSRLAHPTARVFFAHVISLLPGTLSADLRGRDVCIHALLGSADELQASIADVEARVADLFGERRPADGAHA